MRMRETRIKGHFSQPPGSKISYTILFIANVKEQPIFPTGKWPFRHGKAVPTFQ